MTKVVVADLPTDDGHTPIREEWVNPWLVESTTGYVVWQELEPVLWLELTFTSGIVRYVLAGPAPVTDLESATEDAIRRLFPD